MASRLLIGAVLGAAATTAYRQLRKPVSAKDRITNITDKANQKVEDATVKAEEKIDAAEKVIIDSVRTLGDKAQSLIGNVGEKTADAQASAKKAASDFARNQAKAQLAKGASKLLASLADEAKVVNSKPTKEQATRIFERVSEQVRHAAQTVQTNATKASQDLSETAEAAATETKAAEPQAAPKAEDLSSAVPAMVRLEAERWVRDHRSEGAKGLIVDDELERVTFFVDKNGTLTSGPFEMLGYKVSFERV